MKQLPFLLSILVLLPSFAYAQSIQSLFTNLLGFSNQILIPFLLGMAFLFFAWNAIRYFVIQGDTKEGQASAKNLALYGVLAFVVMIIFWGMVNFLAASIGLQGKDAIVPDYVEKNRPSPATPPSAPPATPPAGNNSLFPVDLF